MSSSEKILLAHGGGGKLTAELISELIMPAFGSTPQQLTDAAEIQTNRSDICFTTDSYVVKPLFFNGGDIGKLAVCGTINDLAVSGSKPVALSMGLIIEEGFEMKALKTIIESAAKSAKEQNVKIVCGDTKVVDAKSADGIFINTSGIGIKHEKAKLGFDRIKAGDKIIVSGSIGEHGMTIMSRRKGIEFESMLKSDCGAVANICLKLLDNLGSDIKFMRDPTRGGLAAVLNEIADAAKTGIEIVENSLPVKPTVRAAAEMLGFDILEIANEGKAVIIVSSQKAEQALELCRSLENGKDAAIIGQITSEKIAAVELLTELSSRRIVQMPYGRELPRIC